MFLGAFLFVHSIFQPYDGKYAFANKLDAVIFMNLIVINALSVYNFYSVIDTQSESQAHPTLVVQLVLVYWPLLYIPFCFIWYCRQMYGMDPLSYIPLCIIRYCYTKCQEKGENLQLLEDMANADVNIDANLIVNLEEQRDDWQNDFKSVDLSEYDNVEFQADPQSTTNSTIPSYKPPQRDRFQNSS